MPDISPPGTVKVEFGWRCADSWHAVADILDIPQSEQQKLSTARELWDWLERRGRLHRLPGALRACGRDDLALLFDPAPETEPADPRILVVRFEAHPTEWPLRQIYEEVLAGSGQAAVTVEDADGARADLYLIAHVAARIVAAGSVGEAVPRALAARRSGASDSAQIFLVGPDADCEHAEVMVHAVLSDPGNLYVRRAADENDLGDKISQCIGLLVAKRSRRQAVPDQDPTVGGYR
jgi:hypothetical protein